MNLEFSKEATLPTKYGKFKIVSVRDNKDFKEHLIVYKDSESKSPLVRIHSECMTGDVFHSQKCDCGEELDIALQKISKDGGYILYLRQEGRGIGLFNKINAYALQDKGLDTVEANEELGFKSDERDYAILGEIFTYLKLDKIKLLTNNPAKVKVCEEFVLVEERVAIFAEVNEHNKEYLKVKKDKMNHIL